MDGFRHINEIAQILNLNMVDLFVLAYQLIIPRVLHVSLFLRAPVKSIKYYHT